MTRSPSDRFPPSGSSSMRRWPPARRTTTPSTSPSSAGSATTQCLHGYQVVGFKPFDPVHKRTEATVTGPDGTTFKVTKGAPQVILALSADGAPRHARRGAGGQRLRRPRLPLVGRGPRGRRRRLAVRRGAAAVRPAPRGCRSPPSPPPGAMGVTVKMVTGDALAIAKETATTVGLGANILDASGLGEVKKTEIGGGGRVHRDRRRFRPGVPRAQVPHRRRAADSAATSSG